VILIGLIAAVIGGLIMGLKTPLISLISVFLKPKKDLFIIFFLVYCLALSFEVRVSSVYSADLLTITALILPTLLILDAGLREDEGGSGNSGFLSERYLRYAISIAIPIGWFVREFFAIAVLFATLYNFSRDNPRKGVYAVAASTILLIVSLFFGRAVLDTPGSSSSQVVFILAVAILTALIFMRRIQRHNLKF
jgi:hypothetical protein